MTGPISGNFRNYGIFGGNNVIKSPNVTGQQPNVGLSFKTSVPDLSKLQEERFEALEKIDEFVCSYGLRPYMNKGPIEFPVSGMVDTIVHYA